MDYFYDAIVINDCVKIQCDICNSKDVIYSNTVENNKYIHKCKSCGEIYKEDNIYPLIKK